MGFFQSIGNAIGSLFGAQQGSLGTIYVSPQNAAQSGMGGVSTTIVGTPQTTSGYSGGSISGGGTTSYTPSTQGAQAPSNIIGNSFGGGSSYFGGGGTISNAATSGTSNILGQTGTIQSQVAQQSAGTSTSSLFGGQSATQQQAAYQAQQLALGAGIGGLSAAALQRYGGTDSTIQNYNATSYSPYNISQGTSPTINPQSEAGKKIDNFLSNLTTNPNDNVVPDYINIGKPTFAPSNYKGRSQTGTITKITPYSQDELISLGATGEITPNQALTKISQNSVKNVQNQISQKQLTAQYQLGNLQTSLQNQVDSGSITQSQAQDILNSKLNDYNSQLSSFVSQQNTAINQNLEKAGADIGLQRAVITAPLMFAGGFGTASILEDLPVAVKTAANIGGSVILGKQAYNTAQEVSSASSGIIGAEKLGTFGINLLSFGAGAKAGLSSATPQISDIISRADLKIDTISKINSAKTLNAYLDKANIDTGQQQFLNKQFDLGTSASIVKYKLVPSPQSQEGDFAALTKNVPKQDITSLVFTDRFGNVVNSYQLSQIKLGIEGRAKPFVQNIQGTSQGAFNDEGALNLNTISLIGDNRQPNPLSAIATRSSITGTEVKVPQTLSIDVGTGSRLLIPADSVSVVNTISKDSILGRAEPFKAKYVNPEQIVALRDLLNTPAIKGEPVSQTNLMETRIKTGSFAGATRIQSGVSDIVGLSADKFYIGKGEGNVFFDRNALADEGTKITKAGKPFSPLPIKEGNGFTIYDNSPSTTTDTKLPPSDLLGSDSPSYVGGTKLDAGFITSQAASSSPAAIREALSSVPQPSRTPGAATFGGTSQPSTISKVNTILNPIKTLAPITSPSFTSSFTNQNVIGSSGTSLSTPSSSSSSNLLKPDTSLITSPTQTTRELTRENLIQPSLSAQSTQTKQQQRELTRESLLNPNILTQSDITFLTPVPPSQDGLGLRSRALNKAKKFLAFTKRKGKLVKIGEFSTPDEAFNKGEQVSRQTLARSTFVYTDKGQPVSPFLIPADFRLGKKNRNQIVQRKALNRGSQEIPEIKSYQRRKTIARFKPTKTFAKARKITKARL